MNNMSLVDRLLNSSRSRFSTLSRMTVTPSCSSHGISKARIYGIGSLNGVRFTDGTSVASHATEVSIREGWAEHRDGEMRASLSIDVVDMQGGIFSGTLVRGDNPVCVTFELVIVDAENQSSPSS